MAYTTAFLPMEKEDAKTYLKRMESGYARVPNNPNSENTLQRGIYTAVIAIAKMWEWMGEDKNPYLLEAPSTIENPKEISETAAILMANKIKETVRKLDALSMQDKLATKLEDESESQKKHKLASVLDKKAFNARGKLALETLKEIRGTFADFIDEVGGAGEFENAPPLAAIKKLQKDLKTQIDSYHKNK